MTDVAAGLPFQIYTPGLSVWLNKGAPEGKQRRIGGLISTDNRDRQGEIVIQKGLDFSEFLNSGWFNDNHSKETDSPVGYPDSSSLKYVQKGEILPNGQAAPGNGHWSEGYLLDSMRGNKIWDLAQSLHKAGDERRLGFSIEGSIQKRIGSDRKTIAKAKVRNVAITNCFPGDVRVSGSGQSVTRRQYRGPMVEIVLESGEKLTGTPNHPIFTERGWIALGDLDKVHDSVGRSLTNNVSALPLFSRSTSIVPHDVKNVPPTFQQVFDFARDNSLGIFEWVRSIRKGQFHGDVLTDGDVDVVLVHGFLKRWLHSAFFEKFGKDALPASDKQLPLFSGFGFFKQLFGGAFHATYRVVRSLRKLFSFGWGSTGISTELFFAPVSSDSESFGDVEYGDPGDPITGRDSGRTLSRAIGFSNLVSKRVFDFNGHVFNLDTAHGWYEANGIVAHNCPVNVDTRMETLVKSLVAVEESQTPEELWKALGMGTGAGDGPAAQPAGPQTGATAGQVLTPESLEQKKRKNEDKDEESEKSLTPERAWEMARARFPSISATQVGQLIGVTRRMMAQRAA